VLLVSPGCKRESQATADSTYRQVEKEFVSGDLPKALKDSQEAYREFEMSSSGSAADFRLESAKILIWQGNNKDALVLLQQMPIVSSDTRFEVRRKILLSIAQARLGQRDRAEITILEAERQSPDSSLRAEVAGAKGSVDMEKGDLDDAERQFQASLAGALFSQDRFRQTQSLVNL